MDWDSLGPKLGALGAVATVLFLDLDLLASDSVVKTWTLLPKKLLLKDRFDRHESRCQALGVVLNMSQGTLFQEASKISTAHSLTYHPSELGASTESLSSKNAYPTGSLNSTTKHAIDKGGQQYQRAWKEWRFYYDFALIFRTSIHMILLSKRVWDN